MATQGKGTKVGKLEIRQLGVEADVRYHRTTGKFTIEFAGQTYTSDRQAEVESIARTAIEQATNIEWVPVIEVYRHSPANHYSDVWKQERHIDVRFDHARYWLGFIPSLGGYRAAGWDVPEKDRLSRSHSFWWREKVQLALPRVERHDEHSYHGGDRQSSTRFYLPYSDALWAGLEQAKQVFEVAKMRLDDLLSTDEGRASIEANGLLMLAAPVPADKP